MTRLGLLLASVFALGACQPAEDAPASTSNLDSTSIIASPEAFAGEYRVAGVDGMDLNLPHGVTAVIDESRIEVASDCIRFAWTYRFEAQMLVTEQAPVASCRRAVLPLEQALSDAVEAADIVRRTPANGVELTGGGRSLTLFNQ